MLLEVIIDRYFILVFESFDQYSNSLPEMAHFKHKSQSHIIAKRVRILSTPKLFYHNQYHIMVKGYYSPGPSDPEHPLPTSVPSLAQFLYHKPTGRVAISHLVSHTFHQEAY
jgi:hypothetical protein